LKIEAFFYMLVTLNETARLFPMTIYNIELLKRIPGRVDPATINKISLRLTDLDGAKFKARLVFDFHSTNERSGWISYFGKWRA
jgi:hypothetical protein